MQVAYTSDLITGHFKARIWSLDHPMYKSTFSSAKTMDMKLTLKTCHLLRNVPSWHHSYLEYLFSFN